MESSPLEVFKNMWIWHLGICFSSKKAVPGLRVGFDNLLKLSYKLRPSTPKPETISLFQDTAVEKPLILVQKFFAEPLKTQCHPPTLKISQNKDPTKQSQQKFSLQVCT